jgi:hypothetical protein
VFYLRAPFTFPTDLASALETALARSFKHNRLGASLRALWPKLAQARGRAAEGEQHYSFQRADAEAYAAYYLPANCLKPALVLEESFLLGQDPAGEEVHWLDLGTGPGTAYWGAAWWCARRNRRLRFTGWDQSTQFTSIARDLAAGSPFRAPAEFVAGEEQGPGWAADRPSASRRGAQDTREGPIRPEDPISLVRRLKPTHVSFVNSIAEIYPDMEARRRECAKLLQLLSDLGKKDGKPRYLLLIEPGSRESSRELAALKDALRPVGTTLLPCLDERPCGALKDPKDWCHEEAACEFPGWLNELGAEAGLRKEALLFSYAWIRAGSAAPAAYAGCSRIVSQRMERKGQVECRICAPEGKRPVRVQRSKASAESEFLFDSVRGELWRNAEIGEKGDVARAAVIAPQSAPIFG